MPIIARDTQRLGNVLKHEYEPSSGYCRETVTVNVTAGMEVGTVLTAAGAVVTSATAADAALVLIDTRVRNLAAGNHEMLVLARGPVILADDALKFSGSMTDAQKATAFAALAAKGMLVSEQV